MHCRKHQGAGKHVGKFPGKLWFGKSGMKLREADVWNIVHETEIWSLSNCSLRAKKQWLVSLGKTEDDEDDFFMVQK